MYGFFEKIRGYKTYVVGCIAIASAVVAAACDGMSLTQTIEAIVAAIMAMTIRSGITTEAKKAAEAEE